MQVVAYREEADERGENDVGLGEEQAQAYKSKHQVLKCSTETASELPNNKKQQTTKQNKKGCGCVINSSY